MVNKFLKVICDSGYRFKVLVKLGLYNRISDENLLKKLYKIEMGKKLDLSNPVTFNEKLQWLKLYDRNPDYIDLVDKFEVKKIVATIIGDEYIIPTLGVWEKFDDIDFSVLPNQFVLKCTHDSGGVVICNDKMKFDYKKARQILQRSLKKNFYYFTREWPYKDIKPRIIAEQYIEEAEFSELRDYKFFCFNGEVKSLFIASERQDNNVETKFDFFDREFNHLKLINGHPNADVTPRKPKNFDKMIHLAEILSKDIPHVRVDFYEVEDRIYFGEMTFYHWSGMVPFEPEEWDYLFGRYIDLSSVKQRS